MRLVVLMAFLFMIGFCTRVTSALTWMASLWYIHRSPVVLFGVDTMQMIMLLYLMIGPSGAALSVDRLIARWWSRNKLSVVNRWRALWGKPALNAEQIVPAVYQPQARSERLGERGVSADADSPVHHLLHRGSVEAPGPGLVERHRGLGDAGEL